MPNLLVGLETVKRAGDINGTARDAELLRIIESESRRFEGEVNRTFIPITATRRYPWPPLFSSRSHRLWLDQDILSVTTLQTKAEDSSPTTIAAADYFLEPQQFGPPYNRIEIDLSSSSVLESGNTSQRSILVTGSWAYGNDTVAAGTVASGLAADATATTMVCSDGSLIDTGDTLLIGTDQLYVSGRGAAQIGTQQLNGALTADKAGVSVTVDSGAAFHTGEIILVGSERMFVESISGNVLTVARAYDATVLASHADDSIVYGFRSLTVARNVNGTTAAVHADAAAISKYVAPYDVRDLITAATLVAFQGHKSAWGRTVGTGEGAAEWRGGAYRDLGKTAVLNYKRTRHGAV